jgi:dienelactone hydrolase
VEDLPHDRDNVAGNEPSGPVVSMGEMRSAYTPRRMQRATRRKVGLFVLVCALVLLFRPAGAHMRAASLLTRFQAPGDDGVVARYGSHDVGERAFTFEGPRGAVPARVYTPVGMDGAPGVVLVHGVHHTGIDEPRLVRFAKTIAATGVVVMTPEIAELRDYHVDPRSIDTIGAAARALKADVHRGTVGVMGLSFGGGLSLLAAADPRFAADIGFVVAVGAHDDLTRVSEFFATSHITDPDGHPQPIKAHEYGPLVLVYSHIEDFFPKDDVPTAREALRDWLWENRDAARARLPALGPVAREKMERLFAANVASIAPEILAELKTHQDEAARVSPHGRMAGLRAPVFLLHGAGDTVIPASETLWLAKDVPAGLAKDVLVSAAIQHVELEGEPSAMEKWALVHFMADVLAEADRAGRS